MVACGRLVVVEVLRGGPASRAVAGGGGRDKDVGGIAPGDFVLSINGKTWIEGKREGGSAKDRESDVWCVVTRWEFSSC